MGFFKELIRVLATNDPKESLTKQVIKANEKELKKAAKFGWVFVLEMPYKTYKGIAANEETTQETIDTFFKSYFEYDFEGRLKKHLIKNIEILPSYLQGLLKETISSYECGNISICIPALFSLIEGALINLSNSGNRVKIKYKQGLDESVENNKLGLSVIPLISLAAFLEEHFGNKKFTEQGFEGLNRHWSQHGRYLEKVDECSVLKLFNVVVLILWTYTIIPNDGQE